LTLKSFAAKKSTITQVAHLAGVSPTTVSLYLKGNRRVCSPPTALRIDRAVYVLNYEPNAMASAANNKDRRTIGLIAGNDLERGNRPWAVHNSRIVNGILEAANELDFSILTYPHRLFVENRYLPTLDGRADGILFYGSYDNDFVRKLQNAGMPVVCFGSPMSVGSECGCAYADEAAISHHALQHLWDLGHRKIAHLAGPFEDCARLAISESGTVSSIIERGESVSRARRQAAIEFLIEHDAYREAWISGPNAWRFASVKGTLESWFGGTTRPTGIYCANDFLAWEVVLWAREAGLRIPEDIAIIGVDNVQRNDVDPFLSSVDFDIEGVGRLATYALVDFLEGTTSEGACHVAEIFGAVARCSSVGRLARTFSAIHFREQTQAVLA